jgi:hypothetical protein
LDGEEGETAPAGDALTPEEIKEMPASANTPEAQQAWTTLKKENKAFTKELETLRSQVAERSKLADADPIKKENERLAKELEEAREHLKAANVTKHPIYKERIDKPLQRIGQQAAELAKRAEVDQDRVLDIIREADTKRQRAMFSEVAESLDDFDRGELVTLIQSARGGRGNQSQRPGGREGTGNPRDFGEGAQQDRIQGRRDAGRGGRAGEGGEDQ